MSFYRSLLIGVAALALALPVFADEATDAAQPGQTVTESSTTTTTDATTTTQTKVDINKATIRDLTKVKGITPVKAKAIIAYRKKNGDFKSLDEIKNVKGFKKLSADKIKEIEDQLTTS